MNTDKLIPILYVNKFTPLVVGDEIYNAFLDVKSNLTESGALLINGSDYFNQLFVVSFADRPNTGTQPVGDDVVVDVSWNDSAKAQDRSWKISNPEETWKPNYAAMLKQYKAEQLAKGVHIDSDGDLAVGSEKVGVATPVFTQAMADAVELPPVGCSAICTYTEDEHKIVAHDLTDYPTMALTVDNSGYWGADASHWKPIQTEEDKIRNILTNALIPVFVVNYLLDNDELTVTLNKA